MIVPGDTIVGLDMGGHISVVLSHPTAEDEIAFVNLSKHGRPRYSDHAGCVIVRRAEYPVLYSDSCVILRAANLNPLRPLLVDQARGRLAQRDPVPPPILLRMQQAVLNYRFTSDPVREAIRASLAPPGVGGA